MSRYEVVTVVRNGLSNGAFRSILKGISHDIVKSQGILRNVASVAERKLPLSATFHTSHPNLNGPRVAFDFVVEPSNVESILLKIHENPHVVKYSTLHFPDKIKLDEEAVSLLINNAKVEVDSRLVNEEGAEESSRVELEVLNEVLQGDVEVKPMSVEELRTLAAEVNAAEAAAAREQRERVAEEKRVKERERREKWEAWVKAKAEAAAAEAAAAEAAAAEAAAEGAEVEEEAVLADSETGPADPLAAALRAAVSAKAAESIEETASPSIDTADSSVDATAENESVSAVSGSAEDETSSANVQEMANECSEAADELAGASAEVADSAADGVDGETMEAAASEVLADAVESLESTEPAADGSMGSGASTDSADATEESRQP